MQTRFKPNIERLRQQLKDLDCSTFSKVAEIGDDQDAPFEQSFSNLAHAYLADKAPGLLDYEVGFQLIERNQENTKAVGIFGFKVGKQWLYAPIFFINGDLKGDELLYLKNQDIFVPLKEKWINYLLNKKPNILGKGVDKDLNDLGVISPNLYQLSRSPSKYAEAKKIFSKLGMNLPQWAIDASIDFAYLATTSPLHDPKYASNRNLLDFIKSAGSQGVKCLAAHCHAYPRLLTYLNDYYGEDQIQEAVKVAVDKDAECNSILHKGKYKKDKDKLVRTKQSTAELVLDQAKEAESYKVPKLRVVTYTRVMEVGHAPDKGETIDFDSDEKSSLLEGRMEIADGRGDEEVSTAFNIDIPVSLQSPTESGLYEVLVKPGEFKKCLVVFGPYAHDGRKTFATVVDLDSKKYTNAHASEIWTKTHYQKELFDKWYDGLSKGSISKDSLNLIITQTAESTLPFDAGKDHDSDLDVVDAYFDTHSNKVRAGSVPNKIHNSNEPLNEGPNKYTCHSRIVFTGTNGRAMKAMGKELLIPKNHKVLNLKSGDAVLHLQTAPDFHTHIIKSAELKQLELRNSGTYVQINNGPEQTLEHGLLSLVFNHGFREKQARDMLAISKDKKKETFLVKYADNYTHRLPYSLQRSGPTVPPFPEPQVMTDPLTGGNIPTMPTLEANMIIPGMQANIYDRSVYDPRPIAYRQHHTVDTSAGHRSSPRRKYAADGMPSDEESDSPAPDQETMESAMQAAESGQKEVFDTSMIGSMLKSMRNDSMIDQFIGDIVKGMDRLGRILFMLYWHKDEYEDRYGKQELPELESGLKTSFEAIGTVVLYLEEKTAKPYPDEHSVDLNEIAQ
jgi:hypothetical protein